MSFKLLNTGASPADNNTALFVHDFSGAGTGPIRFIDVTPPEWLSYTFSGLGNTPDNLMFFKR